MEKAGFNALVTETGSISLTKNMYYENDKPQNTATCSS